MASLSVNVASAAAPRERLFLALGLRLLAMALLSVMLLLSKLAGYEGISLSETIFYRQLIPGFLILLWLIWRGKLSEIQTQRLSIHGRRALIGLAGMFLALASVRFLPLTEATVLGFTTPIFAVIMAAVLLKEKVGAVRWLAVVFGLLGILVIAHQDRAHIPAIGLIIGVGAAFVTALTSIQVRDLGRTDKPLVIVFWYCIFSAPFAGIPMLWNTALPSLYGWLLLVGVGICGMLGQLCFTAALRFGNVSSVVMMDYSAFAWAGLWSWLVFSQLPPASTWIGAIVIIGAGLVIAWRQHRRAHFGAAIAYGTK